MEPNKKTNAQSKAIHAKAKESKMYTSPTGSKHRMGGTKHRYWESIVKRGKDNDKYGGGD